MMLMECFADVTEPRVDYLVEHQLTDVIMVAVCATLCGADGWEKMAEWGREKQTWLAGRIGIEKVPVSVQTEMDTVFKQKENRNQSTNRS